MTMKQHTIAADRSTDEAQARHQTALPASEPLTFDALEFYKETWANIRETDQTSFKLLSFVPLISGSGAGLLVFLLDKAVLPLVAVFGLSLLSAMITIGFYRWELRNIQTCARLLQRAKWLEQRFGLGSLAGRNPAPKVFGYAIGKTEAEQLIYTASILAWLVPIMVGVGRLP